MALTTYKYEESGFIRNFPRADMVRRISPIVYNETSQNASRTISYSASQGFVSNISLTLGGKKSAITAGITGGASWSNSYSQSDSVTQTIPKNKYAWMEYYPIMDNSYGILTELITYDGGIPYYEENTYFTDIFIAKKMSNGMPDGVYTLKESSSRPNN